MRYMTKEWYEDCQRAYCVLPFDTALQKQVKDIQKRYFAEYERSFPAPPDFADLLDTLHDSTVVYAREDEEGYVLITDRSDIQGEDTLRISFKKAKIITDSISDKKAYWGYHELYPAEGGYELHVLFFEISESISLPELTLRFENIEIKDISKSEK